MNTVVHYQSQASYLFGATFFMDLSQASCLYMRCASLFYALKLGLLCFWGDALGLRTNARNLVSTTIPLVATPHFHADLYYLLDSIECQPLTIALCLFFCRCAPQWFIPDFVWHIVSVHVYYTGCFTGEY